MYQSYSKGDRTYAAEVITKHEILKPCKSAHQFDREKNIKSEAFKIIGAKEPKGRYKNITKAQAYGTCRKEEFTTSIVKKPKT